MSCKKVTFSPKVTERAGPHKLRSLAAQIYETQGKPSGFAVYTAFKVDKEKDIAWPVCYFSPIASLYCASLLKDFPTSDYDAPSTDVELKLVIGAEGMIGPR
jgi:hypothetical protein